MARFRLDSIAQLSRQMAFAPQEVRAAQVGAAEELLHLIDPAKAYPLGFVVYKVTGYRPKEDRPELLTGLALQHDLGLLIERVSETLNVAAAAVAEPVLVIDDVCEKFNVTSKTIQRWRRRGLPGRRLVFADGKRRVGFLLSSVERFVSLHGAQVAATANVSQVDEGERQEMLRRARRLAEQGRCSVGEITQRVARRMKRSPLTVLHTIRKFDQENPEQAIFTKAPEEIAPADRVMIVKAYRRGVAIKALAQRLGRTRAAVYRVILQERCDRVFKRKARFHDDPLYHDESAAEVIDSLVAQESLAEEPSREELRIPKDLPAYLQDLYRTPLLTPARERALFLKLNFHKFQFAQARRQVEPERVRSRDVNRLEALLGDGQETKKQIVQANLRLVVSVAKKHLRPGINLLDLVSDGNLTLMRAVDGFDVHRGHRFSTYATLALMKGFARSVPQMLSAGRREMASMEALSGVADVRHERTVNRLVERDEVRQLLSQLDERERRVLGAYFGLDGESAAPATYAQVGKRLGLSKERVRQIERGAMAKLRAAAGTDESSLQAGR